LRASELRRKVNRRLLVLAVSCILFILCGISVNAARAAKKHKGLSRLTAGLREVKETAKRARQRLAALNKREDELLDKIDEVKSKEEPSAEDENEATISFATEELAKIRYEKKALTKKIKECTLNKKCILAEIEVVKEGLTDVQPLDPLLEDIQAPRSIKGRITSNAIKRLRATEKA